MVQLDVCDSDSVSALYDLLEANHALPDLLILNAGFGISGAVEETPIDLAKQQMETNFFGVHRLVKAFLPKMREKRTGQIIVIGSLAAQVTVPFQAFYSASKAAISSYTQGLRMETVTFGIRVSLIEPGDHKSDFGRNRVVGGSANASAYHPQCAHALSIMEKSELNGPPSNRVAELVVKIASNKKPKFRYLQIQNSERIVLFLKWAMSLNRFEKTIMTAYRVPIQMNKV